MKVKVPTFPISVNFNDWNELMLLAATIFLEAENQPDHGKLAIAYVVLNRCRQWNKTIHEVILQPWQFSCFNTDYRTQALGRLARVGPWAESSWKAAATAVWGLSPDPTEDATHYLNAELTRKIRPDHDLPDWADPTKLTVSIGSHDFYRLG